MKFLVVLASLLLTASALLFKQEKWNGLKVTWGPNPLSSDYFVSQPRTTADAISQGYTKISDCDTTAKWRGAQYVKDNDYALILLFDVNGYIAGVQTSARKVAVTPTSIQALTQEIEQEPHIIIPKGQPYPSAKIQPPFVDDGNRYVISAYFTDPSKICTTGRMAADFSAEGTGSNLYIQNSTSPESSTMIPHKEADIGTTRWTKGKCFYTMGQHYWYDLRTDSNCDELFPSFILYNNGELTAFGWAMITDLTSKRYEHPAPGSYGLFMQDVPTCLDAAGTLTTMHIFFTDNVALDLC